MFACGRHWTVGDLAALVGNRHVRPLVHEDRALDVLEVLFADLRDVAVLRRDRLEQVALDRLIELAFDGASTVSMILAVLDRRLAGCRGRPRPSGIRSWRTSRRCSRSCRLRTRSAPRSRPPARNCRTWWRSRCRTVTGGIRGKLQVVDNPDTAGPLAFHELLEDRRRPIWKSSAETATT